MELVILAGGMGSRFGGLKQLTPVDGEGNFILDYSIYDAIRAGFNKVVFIIKEENYELFRETIGKRVEKRIKTEYAFQKNDNIPSQYVIPEGRVKPFGTAHALLCAEDKIDDDFIVINSDDFYGKEAYQAIADRLRKHLNKNEFTMVGYTLAETLSDCGNVKRGICFTKENFLQKIVESEIKLNDNGEIYSRPLDSGEEWKRITGKEIASTNFFGFNKNLFKYLQEGFDEFLNKNKEDLSAVEYLLPSVVDKLIEQKEVSVEVLSSSAKWQGITYKEDLAKFKKFIESQKALGNYPQRLWQKD